MKIANKDARRYVQSRTPFEGSNLFAQQRETEHTTIYTVYSYGYHFPLYICEYDGTTTTWYENVDGYSRTTSKHKSQAHPRVPCQPMTTKQMVRLAAGGIIHLMQSGVAA